MRDEWLIIWCGRLLEIHAPPLIPSKDFMERKRPVQAKLLDISWLFKEDKK
jgi:hypothetical protein